MHRITTNSSQTLYYVGKDLKEGPLPTVIYFALSAKESLRTDPFNQMVAFLEKYPMRIFSVDLPYHGEGLAATDAMKAWAEEILAGNDPLTPFLEKTAESLQFLLDQGHILEESVAVVGLSRGAFVATDIAGRLPWIKNILGFAPLTKLSYAKEFHSLLPNEIVSSLDLSFQIPQLIHKTMRFYISNRDTRVSTKECFTFISTLANHAYEERVRVPHIELLIKPPLGHQGHGTSKEIFEEGAMWLLDKLKVPDGK